MIYIALLHYPVKNSRGDVVTTSIANMDIHDIARAAKTFGVKVFYIVNPIKAQQDLARKIISHWQEGHGAGFNPSRAEAFRLIRIHSELKDVLSDIKVQEGREPLTIVTGANIRHNFLTVAELKRLLKNDQLPYLLIFGTGFGIDEEKMENADYRLEPIKGAGDYNHLSVRSAVAIILDRVLN
ncbi:MAG TPA: RNA methyltransferase [Deltaproteobacteria bacterium]|nr:RNA methyltransferase [Deltaproteobacteria bacterium]